MEFGQIASLVFGFVLLLILLTVSLKYPYPSNFQYTVMRILLALASSCAVLFVTGFIRIEIQDVLEAGGAFAIFVLVYFWAPAALRADADWMELQKTWANLRDINTTPGEVHQGDAVRALNAVNKTAETIHDHKALFVQFEKAYGDAYRKLYSKLKSGVRIEHEHSNSDELLTSDAHFVATRMGCRNEQ